MILRLTSIRSSTLTTVSSWRRTHSSSINPRNGFPIINNRSKGRTVPCTEASGGALEHCVRQSRARRLAQLHAVSEFFLAFTHPFFYRFGTFSRYGLHFPHAPTPYPSLDLPELGNAELYGEERRRLLEGIRRLELNKHTTHDCSAFYEWVAIG